MKHEFETLAIHAGIMPDELTGAVMTPIYQTSTYAQNEPGNHKGFEYSRTDNPTRSVLQTQLAALEGAESALVFASGMAAIDAVLNLLSIGDHVIAGDDLYGGTRRLFSQVATNRGIEFEFVDLTNHDLVASAVRQNTKLIWAETPTNPMLKVVDLQWLAAFARSNGLLSVVDNTFMSPYLQNPIEFGIDVVMHSMTKWINGHSDVVMGSLMFNEPNGTRLRMPGDVTLGHRLKFLQNSIGAVPGPFDCWLVLRGIKTLALRMERTCTNALQIASFLQQNDQIENVIYPGLSSHPQHELATRQTRGHGGIVSFEVKGGLDAATRFLSELKLFAVAESLGGVESLAEHPGIMTHASVPKEVRTALGISDGLVRLSIGIESPKDLILDIEQALEKTG